MRGRLSLWLWVHGRFLVCDPSEIHGVKPLWCAIFVGEIASWNRWLYSEVSFSAARLVSSCVGWNLLKKKSEVYVFQNPWHSKKKWCTGIPKVTHFHRLTGLQSKSSDQNLQKSRFQSVEPAESIFSQDWIVLSFRYEFHLWGDLVKAVCYIGERRQEGIGIG